MTDLLAQALIDITRSQEITMDPLEIERIHYERKEAEKAQMEERAWARAKSKFEYMTEDVLAPALEAYGIEDYLGAAEFIWDHILKAQKEEELQDIRRDRG